MSRGLSELQKTMLTMPVDEHGQIYVKDVITKYYGWKQGPNGHFNKTEIGPKTYMSAYIAIRKSLKRLSDRGLIWCIGRSRFDLTNEGRELSAKLNSRIVKPHDLTPEEIDVLDRADNEPPEGSPSCDPWADFWICRQCFGGLFESFSFIHAPVFCPLCGKKNTLVRQDMVPDAWERVRDAKDNYKKAGRIPAP